MGGIRVAKERITWLLPHTLKSRHKPSPQSCDVNELRNAADAEWF